MPWCRQRWKPYATTSNYGERPRTSRTLRAGELIYVYPRSQKLWRKAGSAFLAKALVFYARMVF